jgi:glycosyltransferase involved in cell wall biosynthesis
MKRILVIFHPFKTLFPYLEKEGEELFAPHHYWFFDKLRDEGYEVDVVSSNDETWINHLGDALRINRLQQQLDALKLAKNYDAVFVPYMEYSFILALLKQLGLFKKPLIGLSHFVYHYEKGGFLKKLYYNAVRYVYFKGIDRILFYSQSMLDKTDENKIKGNYGLLDNFGVDFDFFDAFIQAQTEKPSGNYIFSTGGAKRDFDTLIQAFQGLDSTLRITSTGGDLQSQLKVDIPSNVSIDNSLPFGYSSTGLIRQEYYHAKAVAVPLQRVDDYLFGTWGLTVVVEGMSMGKPIISTYNPTYPFNLEKEKAGIYVDFDDVNGWREAIRYLLDHPEEAIEMGERGRHLTRTRYNYQKFSQGLIQEMNQLLQFSPQIAKLNRKPVEKGTLRKVTEHLLTLNFQSYLDYFS